ncbi:CC180 protein, partial [Chloroceryle aenea]|nr:CC180 protein [Chloroceryle aenea]
INRELLDDKRTIAKLFFNLMKSEVEKELSHQLKWQVTVMDWKLTQKNSAVQHFRELMEKEERENLQAMKTEMENMIMEQTSLSERRLEALQRLGCDLLPSTHTKAEMDEWYNSLVDLN